LNIAVVVSEFNQEITSRMLSVAQEKAITLKLKITYICKVPGAYDMPIIVDSLLQKKNVDGVVTLGISKTCFARNYWSWYARKTCLRTN
jgi:6,7-dimethyl-8-ribityllumazine synthase